MLWNSLFEFFVIHIFGGILSDGTTYGGILGRAFRPSSSEFVTITTATVYGGGNSPSFGWWSDFKMPLGNYLSMIATIISISIIVVLCCLFVYKIIKLIGGLIR